MGECLPGIKEFSVFFLREGVSRRRRSSACGGKIAVRARGKEFSVRTMG